MSPRLFAIRAARLRLITQEKQSNPGHHAREQHNSEDEENISQGVVRQHGREYSSGHIEQPAKREEEQEVYRMLFRSHQGSCRARIATGNGLRVPAELCVHRI